MRLSSFCAAALLALVMLMVPVACDTVDPDDCWPNTSGGFGGSGTIPIGAAVGSGDYHPPPRYQPLGYPGGANPCVTMGGDTVQPGGTTSQGSSGAGGSVVAPPPLPLCASDEDAGSAANPCILPPVALCDSNGGADAAANPCIMPPENACYAKCDADYENAAAACGKIAGAAQRTTCQDNAYANYKSCRANCYGAQKTCLDMFDACQDIGGECTKAYPGCDTYGSSACKSCFNACERGDSYPSKCMCKSCGFTQ
jgi:hypothetical protein